MQILQHSLDPKKVPKFFFFFFLADHVLLLGRLLSRNMQGWPESQRGGARKELEKDHSFSPLKSKLKQKRGERHSLKSWQL